MTSTHSERCPERAKLSDAVEKAITETYQRRAAYEDAKAKKKDTVEPLAALQAARDSQMAANRALAAHLGKHGCQI